MKKFTMLVLAMSLFLVACGGKKEQKPAEQPAATTEAPATTATTTEAPATGVVAVVKTFTLKTEDGKEFTLVVVADGSTATLTDAEGKVTELKNAETASGERYTDDAGDEVAIKGTEGVLTLGDLKEVPVTVEAK